MDLRELLFLDWFRCVVGQQHRHTLFLQGFEHLVEIVAQLVQEIALAQLVGPHRFTIGNGFHGAAETHQRPHQTMGETDGIVRHHRHEQDQAYEGRCIFDHDAEILLDRIAGAFVKQAPDKQ